MRWVVLVDLAEPGVVKEITGCDSRLRGTGRIKKRVSKSGPTPR